MNIGDNVDLLGLMGHSFGLEHSTDPYSIMYADPSGRMVSSPQYCDVSAVNSLYNYGG